MSSRLQENARGNRANGPAIQPTELVLDHEYTGKVLEFVKEAKSEILVCAYAWRWYSNQPEIGIQKLNMALLAAKRRGVRVRVLCSGYRVHELLRTFDFDSRYVERTRMLHTKAVCVDNKTLIIGSHNLTKRANTDNYEVSVAIQETEPILQFKTYFEKIWERSHAT